MAEEKNGIKIPGWAISTFVSLGIVVLGVAVVWGQVRTDVDNLKDQVKPMAQMQIDIAHLQSDVTSLRSDTQDIKQGVNALLRRNDGRNG